SLEGLKPVLLYPLFGILLIGAIIIFVINPPVAAINTGLTNFLNTMGESSKVILGIVLGAMMAIDMGGPINKAAYVFGTAGLASGQFDIMAAVMIGGMVPPLSIALCTTFFKNRFTKRERQSGLTNYIMGFSFITEGAIPFAAADPLRVIPACAVGSAVAGGLSMALGCQLRAPHGGIFVVPVIENPLGYLIALAAGAVVGMILLAILKKPLKENA
ncbi:MAG: PTS fructose transporter subunit IIC, partial [Cetobacterium sp.]